MSRQRYDFFDKQSDTSSNTTVTPIDISKVSKDMPDENVIADDLSLPRNGNDESGGNERVLPEKADQPELNLEGLDHLPLIHDLPDLKPGENEMRLGDLSPHRNRSRGLKRGLSPSNDTQDSESQDSYSGSQQQGMMPSGHQENDFLTSINEGGKKHF